MDGQGRRAGIPDAARKVLFERFARSDGARGREMGGAGFGLALSRAIVQAHAGRLELVDGGGPGATFRVFLPAAQNGNINATVGGRRPD